MAEWDIEVEARRVQHLADLVWAAANQLPVGALFNSYDRLTDL